VLVTTLIDDLTFKEFSMKRGSFFLSLAAGLLASLAFTTPSEAGAIVTTSLLWTGLSPAPTSITLDFSTATGPISDLTFVGGIPAPNPPLGPGSVVGEDITLNFSPTSASGFLVFTFESSVPDSIPLNMVGNVITLNSITAQPGGQTGPSASLSARLAFSAAAVPEPGAFGLLGIGMTGLLAFRRLFKRASVA
jgi:hypothetical protein